MPVTALPASAAPATAPFAAPATAPTTTSRTTFVALLIMPFDEPDLRDFLLELFLLVAEDVFLVADFLFVAFLVGMIAPFANSDQRFFCEIQFAFVQWK